MRYPAAEKLEIIRLVEQSSLSVRRTLAPLDIPRSTFYVWYERYLARGAGALEDGQPGRRAGSGISCRTPWLEQCLSSRSKSRRSHQGSLRSPWSTSSATLSRNHRSIGS